MDFKTRLKGNTVTENTSEVFISDKELMDDLDWLLLECPYDSYQQTLPLRMSVQDDTKSVNLAVLVIDGREPDKPAESQHHLIRWVRCDDFSASFGFLLFPGGEPLVIAESTESFAKRFQTNERRDIVRTLVKRLQERELTEALDAVANPPIDR